MVIRDDPDQRGLLVDFVDDAAGSDTDPWADWFICHSNATRSRGVPTNERWRFGSAVFLARQTGQRLEPATGDLDSVGAAHARSRSGLT